MHHPGEPPSPPSPIPKPKPSLLGRLGGTGKDEQKMADWRDKTEEAEEEHRRALASYQQRRDQEQYRIDRENAKAQADADRQNRQVEEMQTAYAEGAPEAVSWFVLQALARSEYPGWYPPKIANIRFSADRSARMSSSSLSCRPPTSSLKNGATSTSSTLTGLFHCLCHETSAASGTQG